ncbi:MAG: hypothetical protein R6W91_07820, partial [Thermoplasmata archaeon]
MPPKRQRNQSDYETDVPVTSRRNGDLEVEREILGKRLSALLFECDDFWSGKRGKHSHGHRAFEGQRGVTRPVVATQDHHLVAPVDVRQVVGV